MNLTIGRGCHVLSLRCGRGRARRFLRGGHPFEPLALQTEGGRIAIEVPQERDELSRRMAVINPPIAQARRVGLDRRTVAAIATAVEAGAERPAAGMRHRAEARDTPGDRDADDPLSFAVETDGVTRRSRSPAGDQRREDFNQLMMIDRAAPQLEIDFHVL